MENLKEFGSVNTQPIQESAQDEKTEKIQVLLSKEDLTDWAEKFQKRH